MARRSVRTGRARTAVLGLCAAALAAAPLALPAAAQAHNGIEPVTVETSVDGVVDGVAFTGATTSVSLAVTNRSSDRTLGLFAIVVPPGVQQLRAVGVDGPGTWSQRVSSCPYWVPRCAALVWQTAGSRSSAVPPGGTVTASITFTAPDAAGIVALPLYGIGDGLFAVSGPTPAVTVVDGVATSFAVSVPATATAGEPVDLALQALAANGHPTRLPGGELTITLASADDGATIGADTATDGTTFTVPVAPSATGAFAVPITFTKAQTQGVTVAAGAVSGTSAELEVVAGPPATLHITSLTDISQDPALPRPAADQAFRVDVTVNDAYGNRAPVPDQSLTLSARNGSGVLTAATVSTTDGRGSIEATYSAAQQGLVLQVDAAGLTPDTVTTDVDSAGTSVLATPGTAATLLAGTANASLPAGGYGSVFLTTAPCATAGPGGCGGSGTEVHLDGTFTDPQTGSELYTNAHPARVAWGCPASACPHRDVFWGDWRNQVEDFNRYPVEVSLKVGGQYQPYAVAPSCVNLYDWRKLGKTGVIDSAAAKNAGFCVDVYAITRARTTQDRWGRASGELVRPILFVEDPKMRG
jgi:hypothetical protein